MYMVWIIMQQKYKLLFNYRQTIFKNIFQFIDLIMISALSADIIIIKLTYRMNIYAI